jgi:hypothetical protein
MTFNLLFPIFCFGLVITAVVILGVLQARDQFKSDDERSNGVEEGPT